MSPSELPGAAAPAASAKIAANAKIEVTGTVNLGTLLELRQRVQRPLNSGFRMSAGLPSDGTLQAVDANVPFGTGCSCLCFM